VNSLFFQVPVPFLRFTTVLPRAASGPKSCIAISGTASPEPSHTRRFRFPTETSMIFGFKKSAFQQVKYGNLQS
jgi:hypothetical protein